MTKMHSSLEGATAMAFLVPALTAGGSDVLLLYLSATFNAHPKHHGEETSRKFEIHEKLAYILRRGASRFTHALMPFLLQVPL
jgi:hypothetical protein